MIAASTRIAEYIHIMIAIAVTVSQDTVQPLSEDHDASDTVMDQFDELGSIIHNDPARRKPSLDQVWWIAFLGSRANVNSRSSIQQLPRDTCCCFLNGWEDKLPLRY